MPQRIVIKQNFHGDIRLAIRFDHLEIWQEASPSRIIEVETQENVIELAIWLLEMIGWQPITDGVLDIASLGSPVLLLFSGPEIALGYCCSERWYGINRMPIEDEPIGYFPLPFVSYPKPPPLEGEHPCEPQTAIPAETAGSRLVSLETAVTGGTPPKESRQ